MVWHGRTPQTTPWSDDKVEELKRLWAAGCSATDIASELGDGISRCGVLGKINRLGLERRRKPAPRKPRAQTVPRGRPILRRPAFIAPVEVKEKPVHVEVLPEPPSLPRMRRLQLVQLADHHCRWPFGNPAGHPFYFCAADKDEHEPYCRYHMDRAFVKQRGR
jgi:GcrA cell cycle regulator